MHSKILNPSLVDVLRSLSSDALDSVYASLCSAGCVGDVRLACSELRRLMDSCVPSLCIVPNGALPADSWPSLSTWPRCKRLEVAPRNDDEILDPTAEQLAEMVRGLQVWLLHQPPVCLERVRELNLDLWAAQEDDMAPLISAPFVALLARLMPNLKVVELHGSSISQLPTRQHELHALMHSGLGRLAQLETLTLPRLGPLAVLQPPQPASTSAASAASAADAPVGAGGAGRSGSGPCKTSSGAPDGCGYSKPFSSVRSLSVDQSVCGGDDLSEAVIAGIASLSGLRELDFNGCVPDRDSARLRDLIERLPPGLVRFQSIGHIPEGAREYGRVTLELKLNSGELQEVAFQERGGPSSDSVSYRSLALLARDVLLPLMRRRGGLCGSSNTNTSTSRSRTSGGGGSDGAARWLLHRLTLGTVSLRAYPTLPVPVALLEGEELDALQQLVRGSSQVQLEHLSMSLDTPEQAVLQAAEVLGWPRRLAVNVVPEPSRRGYWGHMLQLHAVRPPPLPLPQSVAAVVGMAFEDVVAKAVQLLLAQPPLPAGPLPTALVPVTDDDEDPNRQLLVLRGPLIAGLAPVPQALSSWLEWLGQQASAAMPAEPADVDEDERDGEALEWTCQLVPGEQALLLQVCSGGGAFAALHSAARAVAPAAQLEVTAVQMPARCRWYGTGRELGLSPALMLGFQEVLDQGVWRHPHEEGAGSCGQAGNGGGEGPPMVAPPLLEQVRWLQRLGRMVASELPRMQTLSWTR